jgi:hypothetical protein
VLCHENCRWTIPSLSPPPLSARKLTLRQLSTQLMVKFSILTQYKRVFSTETSRKIFISLLIYLTVYALFCLGSSILTCVPVAKYWDDTIPGGCINRSNLHYGIAAVNILNDFILLCIPAPFLRKLQITKRAKYVLIGCFTCGGLWVTSLILPHGFSNCCQCLHCRHRPASLPVRQQLSSHRPTAS